MSFPGAWAELFATVPLSHEADRYIPEARLLDTVFAFLYLCEESSGFGGKHGAVQLAQTEMQPCRMAGTHSCTA